MDHVSRLIALFILLALCNFARADSVPSSPGWTYSGQSSSTIYSSASAAAYGRGAQYCGSSCTVTSAVCYSACASASQGWRIYLSNGSQITNGVSQSGSLCPANSTLSGSSCSCESGYSAANGQCVLPCDGNKVRDSETGTCDCKTILSAGSFMVTGDVFQGCNAGCGMVLRSGWYDKTANTTWGNWSQTGSACSAGEPSVLSANDPKVESAKQCAAGTCPGTVNGQSVCVPCDKSKQTGGTTKSESASQTPSGASAPVSSGSSSEESSEETECKDGQCTTNKKTIGKDANGDKTEKNEKTVQPQSKYCEANPKAAVCKGTESSWGGTCGSFSCDGDAVNCAIAQASWKSACSIDIDGTDSKVTAGNTALAGGDRPAGHPGLNPTSSVFSANLDQSNPYGSTCPGDLPLDVLGQHFSIPLSTACPSLQFMGQVAVAFALLSAAFIVFGAVKG